MVETSQNLLKIYRFRKLKKKNKHEIKLLKTKDEERKFESREK